MSEKKLSKKNSRPPTPVEHLVPIWPTGTGGTDEIFLLEKKIKNMELELVATKQKLITLREEARLRTEMEERIRKEQAEARLRREMEERIRKEQAEARLRTEMEERIRKEQAEARLRTEIESNLSNYQNELETIMMSHFGADSIISCEDFTAIYDAWKTKKVLTDFLGKSYAV